ncbi:MAG: hypothetical protein KAI06_08245 [Anaerolineales bacterium]|nr:hypothetical protein [Anaerolineales bacterium]
MVVLKHTSAAHMDLLEASGWGLEEKTPDPCEPGAVFTAYARASLL